jgi:hypothetical protein
VTALPPDPDPATTSGLEPGGGVAPGTTPPESSQTCGLSEPEPRPRHRLTPAALASLIAVAVFVVFLVATAVLLVLNMR